MIKRLLRLEQEEYKYFEELEIHKTLIENPLELLNYFKRFYLNYSKNLNVVNLPKKQIFESKNIKGDFRVMPCVINENIKSVKIIGSNEEQKTIKDKICVGKSFLIDKYDNHIYAMFDVCVLSSFRTAAISILAFDVLNTNNVNNIGIVGVGRIGFYTAYILYKYKDIRKFYCVEINETIKNNFDDLKSIYMPDAIIEYIDLNQLNKKCNSVFLTTNSKKAILNKNNSFNINFISSIGADANNLSELNEDLIFDRMLITDSKQSMLLGDMKKWKDKKIIDEDMVFELVDFFHKKNTDNCKKLFISTGVALQDALISSFIYDKLSSTKKRNQ